ncbi:GNAT family acetyltransferase [Bacillus sp. FJAT-18017]|uniref:GNAT family N-acetyltransferase n=1 Tax=Bacillus sp. FJAT-18017 TaxID=1705566 RepID=UPI0006AD9869|nr:GNAT family N-acetyltransferase [Bacillus sp. FJAT-18017]ALC90661.1 GNAT family acetyltransferase [Bacillus sp. FJAT-18017]
MKIRTATKNDVPKLASLMEQLGYPTTVKSMEYRFNNIESNPSYLTLIAELNGDVVGMAGLCKSLFYEYDGCYVRIAAFVVDSKYRRRGIGEKLILETERWARELGAIAISLNSGNRQERIAAHKFYTSMGFEAKSTGFSKMLI